MARYIKVILALSLLAPVMAIADYSVRCEGYNDETSAPVPGLCINGTFKGTDSETGNEVTGDCEIGGEIDAYDSETNDHVSGECEGVREDGYEGEGEGEGEGEIETKEEGAQD